jgi:hypothetical protein
MINELKSLFVSVTKSVLKEYLENNGSNFSVILMGSNNPRYFYQDKVLTV